MKQSLILGFALGAASSVQGMTHKINVNQISEPTFHQVALVGETVDIVA